MFEKFKNLMKDREENTMNFYQGTTDLLSKNEQREQDENIQVIKEKISDFSNIKNINFLLGAGASSKAIPNMEKMKKELEEELNNESDLKTLYEEFSNNNNNLEVLLGIMYAKQYYLKNIEEETKDIDSLIEYIGSTS